MEIVNMRENNMDFKVFHQIAEQFGWILDYEEDLIILVLSEFV